MQGNKVNKWKWAKIIDNKKRRTGDLGTDTRQLENVECCLLNIKISKTRSVVSQRARRCGNQPDVSLEAKTTKAKIKKFQSKCWHGWKQNYWAVERTEEEDSTRIKNMRNPARQKNKWVLNFIKCFFHTYSQLLFCDNCILACPCSHFPDTMADADREEHRLSTELGMVSSILGGTGLS